jgi:hypothetical protein
MAIFNLTDIEIKPANRSGVYDAAAGVSRTQSDELYNTDIMRYPLDVGGVDKGHYMIIHINEQYHTQFPSGSLAADLPTVAANAKKYGIKKINQAIGTVVGAVGDVVTDSGFTEALTPPIRIPDTAKDILNKGISQFERIAETVGVRTIRRTTETIALYMPDTMNFAQGQSYNELDLQSPLTKTIGQIASQVDAYKAGKGFAEGMVNGISNLSPFFASFLPGNLGQAAFAVGFGLVHNPMIEMLYSSPQFRQFRFDFMFYPRSQKEAKEVQKILRKLQFHQAPEIRKDSYSVFLIPPSEFDIKFYYNGHENPNIPKISTCVLENIDVDYAPGGFSTYEVPGQFKPTEGGTGMPVAIRLSLSFKETEFMTKDHYQKSDTSYSSEFNTLGF